MEDIYRHLLGIKPTQPINSLNIHYLYVKIIITTRFEHPLPCLTDVFPEVLILVSQPNQGCSILGFVYGLFFLKSDGFG